MENKKLLKYLLKDLSELDEMFAESGNNSFDEMEMEFIKNRISGAKRLVKLFLDKENNTSEVKNEMPLQKNPESKNSNLPKEEVESKSEVEVKEIEQEIEPVKVVKENAPEVVVQEIKEEAKTEDKVTEDFVEEKVEIIENNIVAPEIIQSNEADIKEEVVTESPKQVLDKKQDSKQKEMQLEDEEKIDINNKRLGDSFSKEKSVNDIMSDDLSKLEHKLSNRPVTSIKSAIGINDRFQYIRELFEGSADNFVKTVADLDSMDDIKEAVDYLQTNFKWKKNDTSLKFINLIKRRFPNE